MKHRDAVTSCTSRKHCRIAPYRSLILNVPVFSQLLKFVCRMIFTLWDVKCTFFCFYSPLTVTSLFKKKVYHCSSLWTFFIVLSCLKIIKRKKDVFISKERAETPHALWWFHAVKWLLSNLPDLTKHCLFSSSFREKWFKS